MTEECYAYLVDCIKGDFRALHFVENRDISSFEQINDMVKSPTENKKNMIEDIRRFEIYLGEMKGHFIVIGKLAAVTARIEAGKDDPQYVRFEMNTDESLEHNYSALIKQYGFDDPVTEDRIPQHIPEDSVQSIANLVS